MEEKCKTCKHAERLGRYAVYVKDSCPNATNIKGKRVVSKPKCESCAHYEAETVSG